MPRPWYGSTRGQIGGWCGDRRFQPPKEKDGGSASANYRAATFEACRPLGPVVTSNSTAWPSFSDLYPSAVMAEKWTKTSSPDWRWMNPNPFAALNHFTVPCSFTLIL